MSGSADARPHVLVLAWSRLVDDARVLRQIRALAVDNRVTTVGYGPAVDAPGVEHVPIPDEVVSWHKDRRLLLLRRYEAAYWSAPIVRWAREAVRGVGPVDVVVANDIDTVPLAVRMRQRGRAGAVHADLHEYATRQNEESWRWRWFVAPYVRHLVRSWATAAEAVTTVGPALAAEYRREFGIEAGVVANAAPYVDREPAPVGQPLRLVHSGLARRNRHLEVMLEAVRLTERPVELDLYLMPNEPEYLAELRAAAADLPGVRVHDPVPPDALNEHLARADLGIFVLPPVTFNYRNALPNKFFDFVQARLGVVVGPSPEMSALVREHGLGAVTDDFTPASLARTLDALTAAQVARYKANSHRAAAALSAQQQVQGWVDSVAALVRRSAGRSDHP